MKRIIFFLSIYKFVFPYNIWTGIYSKIKIFVIVTTILYSCILSPTVFSQTLDALKAEDILKMSFDDLMKMEVITASKIHEQIKNVAAAVHIVTAEQINERGYFTLEEALSDLPGLQFRNIVGFNSYVFMRGAPNQNNLLLLLVDGVQINELNSGGFYGGGQFNLSDVEQIEVVYGPASALYGTNAISGIINIITKSPKETNKGRLSILGGNFKTGEINFNYENSLDDKDISYLISGMYKTSEKADLAGAEGDNNWTNNMENFENDISLTLKLKLKSFEFGLLYQEKMSSYSTGYKSVGEKYLDRNTLWDISFLNGFAKYSDNLNDKMTLSSNLYYRNATVNPNSVDLIIKATDMEPGSQMASYRPNQLFGIENQFNFEAHEKLMIIMGIVGELEQLSNGFSITSSNSQDIAPKEPGKPNMLNNRLFSYFMQANYKIIDQLSFIGGLRYDFSSYYGQVFTPRAGFVFNTAKFIAKALYNTAFRSPKPWDYNYGIGNKDLSPEKMHSFEVVFSYLFMDNLSIGSSVYKNLIEDKLTKEYSLAGERWINKDKLNVFGFELYGNYLLNDFQIYANYTFTDSYDKEELEIPEISNNTANAGITYSYNSNIKLNLRGNYLGERKNPSIIPNTGENIIDNALIFHGCISYLDFKGFDFQLKINNILDKKYFHPSNRFAGRYRQPQRTVTFKISYNI